MALALLTTMSMPPNFAAVWSSAAFTTTSSRTSTCSARARPPAVSMSAAAVWMVPSSLGCGSTVFAAIATLAPSAAALSAIASPMPREPPVMKRVLPLRDIFSAFQNLPDADDMTVGIADIEIPAAVILSLDLALERHTPCGDFGCDRVDVIDVDIERPVLVERRGARMGARLV